MFGIYTKTGHHDSTSYYPLTQARPKQNDEKIDMLLEDF
jgi:hypothetical protein